MIVVIGVQAKKMAIQLLNIKEKLEHLILMQFQIQLVVGKAPLLPWKDQQNLSNFK
tara:strand:+ start:85 stop:252 length:168 start_codon:yes stop_codon:yes gene_type:complete